MKTIFLAHPFKGDYEANIDSAKEICRAIALQHSINPICPILMYPNFLRDSSPRERNTGLALCLSLLEKCDEVWMAEDWMNSQGCKGEYELAKKLGKTIRQVKLSNGLILTSVLYPGGYTDRIICLVGESGSGKTAIAKALEEQGYNIIHSYTTRPPRYQGEWGHTFITEEDFLSRANKVALNDKGLGGYKYWAERHQYKDKGDSIYVVDPEGVRTLKETINDADILVIYIRMSLELRYSRLGTSHGYEEATRRIERDRDVFDVVECDYCISNDGRLEDTLSNISGVLYRPIL